MSRKESMFITLYRKIEEMQRTVAISDLLVRLTKFYFCGHSLYDMVERSFFYRYSQFIGYGLCYETAALFMMALHGNPTARIVKGTFLHRGEPCAHLWVEFYSQCHWWVLDPCWLEYTMSLCSEYHSDQTLTATYVCRYCKFWSYKTVRQLYAKLLHPQTSYLFYEISRCFRTFSADHDDSSSAPLKRIGDRTLLHGWPGGYLKDSRSGTTLLPNINEPHMIYSRRLINEFMARPQRLRPKNHTLRQARKLWQEFYDIVCQESTKGSIV